MVRHTGLYNGRVTLICIKYDGKYAAYKDTKMFLVQWDVSITARPHLLVTGLPRGDGPCICGYMWHLCWLLRGIISVLGLASVPRLGVVLAANERLLLAWHWLRHRRIYIALLHLATRGRSQRPPPRYHP